MTVACRVSLVAGAVLLAGLVTAVATPPPAPAPAATPTVKPAAPRFTAADFERHVAALRPKLPGEGFTIVVQPPFVVVGDDSAKTVQRYAETTVKFAVERLKRDYFAADPTAIITIWLFKDKASYEKNVKLLTSAPPSSPFGFYLPALQALYMNISTGGGTLVHEIVHPFVAANFPACPTWFNEGLASLYEQSTSRDGHIRGLTNWRLPILQAAIRDGKLLSFEALCATSSEDFYQRDRGGNYAQARYLCYYLQEQGLLVKFYHEFVRRQADDATGYATLQAVLGERDMTGFLRRWEKYVLALRFPEE